MQRAGKIILDDAPYVPLYNLPTIYGSAKNLDWKMRPDEKVLGWGMKIVKPGTGSCSPREVPVTSRYN